MGDVLSPPSPTTCPNPQPSDTSISPHPKLGAQSNETPFRGEGEQKFGHRGGFRRRVRDPEEEELSATCSWP